jgi:transcription elongation factor GreA
MVPKFYSGTCFFLCPRPSADMSLKDSEMVDKVPMTPNGFAKLQEELRWRQQEERPRIIEAIAEARAHGDLSENAEYHAAKEAQSHNEGRITELEDLTARAEIIDLTKMSGSKIKFGATVKLVDEDTDEEKTYQIVGDQEADVKAGRISISSPIARAMIGKEAGESIEVVAPGGSKAYEILSVSWG